MDRTYHFIAAPGKLLSQLRHQGFHALVLHSLEGLARGARDQPLH